MKRYNAAANVYERGLVIDRDRIGMIHIVLGFIFSLEYCVFFRAGLYYSSECVKDQETTAHGVAVVSCWNGRRLLDWAIMKGAQLEARLMS